MLYALGLEEAKNGAGVLMGHSHLVSEALRLGELVEPFSHRVVLARTLSVETLQDRTAGARLDQIMQFLSAP